MTSRRSIMLSLVLGAFLSIIALGTVFAQVPRSISYQGLLMKDNAPVNATANLKINIYDAAGTLLYTESFNSTPIVNGVFNVAIGQANPLPGALKFDQQYFLGVEVDNTGEVQPRTPFSAAPYALNAQTVGGIAVSTTPQPGTLLALDANGKFPASVLQQTAGSPITTINGTGPDGSGNVIFKSSQSTISIVDNGLTNTEDINVNIPALLPLLPPANIVLVAGPGLTGGGVGNNLEIQIATNGITPGMLGRGSVLGSSLDQNVAAQGLWEDALGDLNVGLNATLVYSNTGNALGGSANVPHNIGLNLANPNTWTALQTFNAGITVGGTTTLVGPVLITGNTTQTGNIALTGNLSVTGLAEPNAANAASVANYEVTDNGDLKVTGFSSLVGNTDINGLIMNSSANNGGTVFVSDPQGLTNNQGNLTNTAGNIVNTLGNIINTQGNINNLNGAINNTGALNETGVSTLTGNVIQSGTTTTLTDNSVTIGLNSAGTVGNNVTINGLPNPTAINAASIGNFELNDNGDLQVVGASSLVGNVFMGGTLTVTGLTTTNGGLTNNGAFTENGASTFNGSINQTGAANTVTLAGPTTINNSLIINGALTQSGGNANIAGGSSNSFGTVASSTNNIGGTNSTNNYNGQNNFNGNINQIAGTTTLLNTQVNGLLGSTGNITLATNSSSNTIGNAGVSSNTIQGAINNINGGVNNLNGTTNNVNATVNNVGTNNGSTNNFGTGATTNNNIGSTTSTNTILGLTNIGSALANGNKLIVNGAANTNNPVGPNGVPTGFNVPADFEQIINGDFQVTGWSSLNNLTANNVWINGSLTLGGSASFCANTVQVATLTSWCGGPAGAAISLTTALNQGSLGTSAANTFLGSNFNGNVTITGTTTHAGNIVQTSGTTTLLNTQVNGTLQSTGNITLATTSTTNSIGAAGATNTITGATNNLNATNNNLNGVLNQTGNSNFTGGVSTFNNNNIMLAGSTQIIGNNTTSNISQIVNVQTQTITLGTTPVQQTTLQSTNTTGAAITQQLASVPGKIPVYIRGQGTLNPATPGPNGGASVTLNFGVGNFDNNDAVTVTYYTRASNQFGSIYPSNINVLAGTIQIESTNPNDANIIQVVILRD